MRSGRANRVAASAPTSAPTVPVCVTTELLALLHSRTHSVSASVHRAEAKSNGNPPECDGRGQSEVCRLSKGRGGWLRGAYMSARTSWACSWWSPAPGCWTRTCAVTPHRTASTPCDVNQPMAQEGDFRRTYRNVRLVNCVISVGMVPVRSLKPSPLRHHHPPTRQAQYPSLFNGTHRVGRKCTMTPASSIAPALSGQCP